MSKEQKGQKWPKGKIALYVLSLALIAAMAVASFKSPTSAWPLCVAGLGCLAAANIDRFSEISAGKDGVRAVLKEAQRRVDEITADIAKLNARIGLSSVQRAGRLGSYSEDEKDLVLRETLALLRDADIPKEDVEKIRDECWDRFVRFDYVLAITGNGTIPRSDDPAVQAKRHELRNWERPATPGELRQFLVDQNSVQGLRAELLSEYEYYVANRVHRRPELWAARDEIPQIPD